MTINDFFANLFIICAINMFESVSSMKTLLFTEGRLPAAEASFVFSRATASFRSRLAAFSRCPISSMWASSRSVRRILTACSLSFLALLGAVSVDLSSSYHWLRTSEAAYDELTSCRTAAVLRLVGQLQEVRSLLANGTVGGGNLSRAAPPSLHRLCAELAGGSDGDGARCGGEWAGLCLELSENVGGLLNVSVSSGGGAAGASACSLVIEELLKFWGPLEEAVLRVQQGLTWKEVLSARLLVTFSELNHQLRDFPDLATRPDFQRRWSSVLSYLGFAWVLSEHLSLCWWENVDLQLNSSCCGRPPSLLDAHRWDLSGTELVSGSLGGLEALADARRCLFQRAAPALRLASRSASSLLSVRVCLLLLACLIYPLVMVSFKEMTQWIQNYAGNLRERTEDLKRQRRLAEDLLHQMLPKSVAKQLRKHKHVEAESYDKVGAAAQSVQTVPNESHQQ